MITIVYSTHKDQDYNKKFKEHLESSIGIKGYQILEYQNNNEFSLSQIYNRGISESIYNIVVCCHNDIKLEKNWGKKLLKSFEENPDYGIIGKAGSCFFPESGIYWEKMNETMVGQVYHQPENQTKYLSRYSAKLPFLIPVVTVDGVFISFDKTKIKHKFDESYGKFHFYDHGFCLPNFLDDVKIGITCSFDLTHQSVGQPNEEFYETKKLFLEKHGKNLPLDIKPENLYVPKIDYGKFKGFGKTAIIILTKGDPKLLFNCIDSYINHSNMDIVEFFIADTGSSEEEKIEIKRYISLNSEKVKINLIEYDYYNFAKINNDVVKNHINDDFKFILFSNNDIVLLNDVISGMMDVFRKNIHTGTVGCRLHHEDNTVQHCGIITIFRQSTGSIEISHLGNGSYYRYNTSIYKVSGNSAALLMIRKNVFERCDYFNENYVSCFEDVELNHKCLLLNLENFCDGNLVAYHFDGRTRNKDPKKLEKADYDYKNFLLPFMRNNVEKLKKHVIGGN